MSETKTIKVGTIGYGGAFNMGKQHLDGLCANAGFVPAAVCDLDPSRLEVAKTDFPGIETYTDLDEMLAKSDVELLVVILPHNVHAEIALKCLRAGKHVIVEKPFAITVEECDEIIAMAKENNLLATTYHNRHWDANILTIKEHLSKIGRPYRWESFFGWRGKPRDWWRSDKAISGGILYDWGAHFMEWMLQCMEGEMTEVSGYAVSDIWPNPQEDELEAVVRFKGGALATHCASAAAMKGKDMIVIRGSEGAITATMKEIDLTTLNEAGEAVTTRVHLKPSESEKFYQNIHAHLFHGAELVITPELSRRVIQILHFATKSAEEGKAIPARYA